MKKTKKDRRNHGSPTIKCCLCTIGIGNTKYSDGWFRHLYRKPYIYHYQGRDFILDEGCYKLVLRDQSKLEEAYVDDL